jgi:tRNA1(Val) A37 N6-methylase TrmN6
LEPSCGDGRFIRECFKQGAVGIDVVEICEEEAEKVATEFFGRIAIHVGDFLEFNPITDDNFLPEYDILIGNPPYSRTDWLKHTLHAFKFVKPGGKLVFILPNSIHSNKKFQDFVLDKKWEYREIPAGAFKSEGTNIATNIVTIYK